MKPIGNILLDFDKAGAEWVIVAYFSQDPTMIEIVEGGRDPHTATGAMISGTSEELVLKEHKAVGKNTDATLLEAIRYKLVPELFDKDYFLPRTMSIRQAGKKGNHGLNYDEGIEGFCLINEVSYDEGAKVWKMYRRAYPGVGRMHKYVQHQLRGTATSAGVVINEARTLTNCFGRKCRFMDAWGPDMFRQAYAFTPQSTVVDILNKAIVLIWDDDSPLMRGTDMRMQTHDSLTLHHRIDNFLDSAALCIKISMDYLNPVMEYHGREFKMATDLKMGLRLGEDDMLEVPLTEDVDLLANRIKTTWGLINEKERINSAA